MTTVITGTLFLLLCTFYVFESSIFNLSEFSSNTFCSRLFLHYLHEMNFSLPTFCQSSWSVLSLIQFVSVWSRGVLLETFRPKRQTATDHVTRARHDVRVLEVYSSRLPQPLLHGILFYATYKCGNRLLFQQIGYNYLVKAITWPLLFVEKHWS